MSQAATPRAARPAGDAPRDQELNSAMRRCPACKHSISAEARKCPLCGYRIGTLLLGRHPATVVVSLVAVATIALWILWYVRSGLTIEGIGLDDTMISAASPASGG